ncbi:TPR domain protein, putative component of TonB system [hydrothermal vent metagenome]|uniref:TPR domain protein, putative component of TonB system n=1 Tax=hydrothermal vent metagenome TaxID=652676 RepID=A0A3B0ZJ56_9ZZZZ
MPHILILLTIITFVTACGTPAVKRITLAELDVNTAPISTDDTSSVSKSNDDIRQAYATYLEHASKNDKSRVDALSRLAALEFELSEQMLTNRNEQNSDAVERASDNLYDAKLNRTIELLSTALRDYPDNKNNDKTLYQLAKAYDQQGDSENSHASLKKLAEKHPKSKYFIESQFRLAENAFSERNYALAEDRYTDVIGAKKQSIFYQKSLYKRGWSRFKQAFYFEALDDFFQAVNLNAFDEYSTLSGTKKELFNEYFRAIGLSFSYMDGAESIQYHFKETPDFKHLYPIHTHLSNIYLREERKNDAVTTLEYFAKNNPTSKHVPEALLKVVDIWKLAGFSSRMNSALEAFYVTYHPGSEYWKKRKESDPRIFKQVKNSLREQILTITASYHNTYLKTRKASDYANSKRWYENYLEHYSSYSRKDNIHFLYASLLASNKNDINALKHYELAAYDSNIIIDKNSAYESILLTSKLSASEKNDNDKLLWIEKLTHFSTLYGQQYPNDKRTANIILHAGELAYENKRFKQAIMLTELVTGEIQRSMAIKINTIKGHAYFKLAQYEDAENIYHSILKDYSPAWRSDSSIIDGLALAIYYQGESARKRDETHSALQHYTRISQVAPTAKIAATGMYDAVLLAIQKELWNESIQYAKTFQRLYPHHKNAYDVTKKLTAAYLNSKQDIAAAKELEKLASNQQDRAYQLAAQWKAGELYEANKEYPSAIRSFETYAKNFRRPFPQYMESMFKLVALYQLNSNNEKANQWQNSIVQEDKKVSNSLRTERTRFIASSAALHLARNSHIEYSSTKLRLPLKKSLRKKKAAMQQAVNLYGRASSYNVAETATEATHSIADIYNEFSIALLESELPNNLNDDELEQYQILIEDQAFPFEEKAIEFYEINLSYVKDDIYDQWIRKSHTQLKKLFPVRYQREARLDGYINALH